jgi:hypothetical protein
MGDTPATLKPTQQTIDESLEIRRLQLEVELKALEVKEKEKSVKRQNWLNQSLLIALIGGAVGLFGTLFNNYQSQKQAIVLEKQQLNSSLILKAIETNNRAQSIENLQFLLRLRLITDEGNTLANLLDDSAGMRTVPALLAPKASICITDSLRRPLSGIDIYYNKVFIGKTNLLGLVSAAFSTSELSNNEIDAWKDGQEFNYIDVKRDNEGNITIRVKNP